MGLQARVDRGRGWEERDTDRQRERERERERESGGGEGWKDSVIGVRYNIVRWTDE